MLLENLIKYKNGKNETAFLDIDHRAYDRFWLAGSWSSIAIISLGYLLITFFAINFMKRHPKISFETKYILAFYYFTFGIVSLYASYKFGKFMWWVKYDVRCHYVDEGDEPEILEVSAN